MIFSLAYITHYLFHKLFIKAKDVFDMRFIYDCYHILIYAINGIQVTDYYIKTMIDKKFNKNNFLYY